MIMKGDTGIIRDVSGRIENYAGLNFAAAELEFSDGIGENSMLLPKCYWTQFISPDGEIGHEKETLCLPEVMKHNATFRESRMPSDDKYIGAMRMRYAYATTCHKAQGGEWENVILHPYMPKNDYRWQYTAITRAAKNFIPLLPNLKIKF